MIDSLEALFHEEIKDLHHAEKRQLEALPKMIDVVTAGPLRVALEHHLEETTEQLQRLGRIFDLLGQPRTSRRCQAMEGLIAEAEGLLAECRPPEVRDAAILASVQRMKHYEMAGYGTARTHAQALGHDQAARLLQDSLDEEGALDDALVKVATERVNAEAVGA